MNFHIFQGGGQATDGYVASRQRKLALQVSVMWTRRNRAARRVVCVEAQRRIATAKAARTCGFGPKGRVRPQPEARVRALLRAGPAKRWRVKRRNDKGACGLQRGGRRPLPGPHAHSALVALPGH